MNGFDDRFFERQKREIAARIELAESRRRARRAALPLAAAFFGGLFLLALVLQVPASGPAPAPGYDWVFAWELPAAVSGGDPLASYVGEEPESTQIIDMTEGGVPGDIDPLPPIEL